MHPAVDLSTSVELRGDRAIYTVDTTNPRYQQRLAHMGFSHRRRTVPPQPFSHRQRAPYPHELRQSPRTNAPARRAASPRAVGTRAHGVPARVQGTQLRWFLYGSGALAVRGIDVEPGDLDFCVNDAHLVGALFEDLLVEPVTTMTDWIADQGGRAFAGCLLEWMAGVHPDVDTPTLWRAKTPHRQGDLRFRRS
jgi:hypothetical protein